jgi:type VI secretion system secreted protein VgrG
MINTPAAVTISAAGGVTIVAPGGMKTIDSFFDKTGGLYKDAFAAKLSVLGAKVDIVTGTAISMSTAKVDTVGVKVDIARMKVSNKGQLSLEEASTAIKRGVVTVYLCSQLIIQ